MYFVIIHIDRAEATLTAGDPVKKTCLPFSFEAQHPLRSVLKGEQMDGKIKTIHNQLGRFAGYFFENHDNTADKYVVVVLASATGRR